MLDRRRRLPCTKTAVIRAKELRANLTKGEAILWTALKGRSMRGYDFDRQKPIGDYIVDFYCKALMLAIEIDGDSHRNKGTYDVRRQTWLESQGVRFLRFDDALLRKRPQDALRTIEGWIEHEESGG
jgi:very-short-patch-repair endonuclease